MFLRFPNLERHRKRGREKDLIEGTKYIQIYFYFTQISIVREGEETEK